MVFRRSEGGVVRMVMRMSSSEWVRETALVGKRRGGGEESKQKPR